MKNGKTGLTAVLLGIAFAATSGAAIATTGPASAQLHPAQHVAGKISALDANAMTLTLAVNGKSEQVSYTAATAIREDGKSVAPSALATGEKIRVAFEEKSGKNVATNIDILRAATPAAATKSK